MTLVVSLEFQGHSDREFPPAQVRHVSRMASILLSGPAGAAKSALARRLLREAPELAAIADFQAVYAALTGDHPRSRWEVSPTGRSAAPAHGVRPEGHDLTGALARGYRRDRHQQRRRPRSARLPASRAGARTPPSGWSTRGVTWWRRGWPTRKPASLSATSATARSCKVVHEGPVDVGNRCSLPWSSGRTTRAQSPGRIVGTLLTYEHPRTGPRGNLRRGRARVAGRGRHHPQRATQPAAQPIMRFVPEVRGEEVVIDAPLPDTSRGRDAAGDDPHRYVWRGSVGRVPERSASTGRPGCAGSRRRGFGGAGLVDSPSYGGLHGRAPPPRCRARAGEVLGVAVTITAAALASAIRVGTTTEETAEVTRLRTYAIEAIEKHLVRGLLPRPRIPW